MEPSLAIPPSESGRSTGFAFVNYESQENANLAKRELDGVIAKGEPIRIVVESFIPRTPAPRDDDALQSPSHNGQTSLKDRIARTPLIHRLTDDINTVVTAEDKINARGAGAIRSTRGEGRRKAASDKGPRPEGRSHGGKGKGPPAKPKTADDLDKELEAYVSTAGAKDGKGGEDVDMAA
ncbi:hypothetical protein FRB97_006380 [Tulasnella sp. 331]|nr:hypothetical protein FRB97_006380 [Tulasnella sp. 331]